jgi:hypothetical protein
MIEMRQRRRPTVPAETPLARTRQGAHRSGGVDEDNAVMSPVRDHEPARGQRCDIGRMVERAARSLLTAPRAGTAAGDRLDPATPMDDTDAVIDGVRYEQLRLCRDVDARGGIKARECRQTPVAPIAAFER